MKDYLTNLIKLNGPISVAQFMKEVLFSPNRGYYMRCNPFGKQGDFTTAPEISQVFGELIAAYLVHIWQNSYNRQMVNLVEMGAGRGTLMRDILACVSKICPDFYAKIKVVIIEISPRLKAIQRENLANFSIDWFDDFPSFLKAECGKDNPLFFVANELFDCFAIRQFVMTQLGWVEKLISLDQKTELEFVLAQFNPLIDKMIRNLVVDKQELNAVFEYSSEAVSLIELVSNTIKTNRGIGLIIDYGYVVNQFKDTLQAVKNQKYCSVLDNPGEADLTALVDFGLLKDIVLRSGILASIVTQREFLESLGIKVRQKSLIQNKSLSEQQEINLAVERLVDSGQMGDLFKCLVIWG